jgi:hypothetical protein
VVIFGSASEAFSQKNINCSIAESIARFESVAKAAKDHGLRLRGSHQLRLRLPLPGRSPLDAVADVVGRMRDLGCDEIDIADTIGVSTARKTQAVMLAAAEAFHLDRISGHFHDTYGQALANIYASLEVGVRFSIPRYRAWAAARTQRARPATWRPKMCCTCLMASASRPASTSTWWSMPASSFRSSWVAKAPAAQAMHRGQTRWLIEGAWVEINGIARGKAGLNEKG